MYHWDRSVVKEFPMPKRDSRFPHRLDLPPGPGTEIFLIRFIGQSGIKRKGSTVHLFGFVVKQSYCLVSGPGWIISYHIVRRIIRLQIRRIISRCYFTRVGFSWESKVRFPRNTFPFKLSWDVSGTFTWSSAASGTSFSFLCEQTRTCQPSPIFRIRMD